MQNNSNENQGSFPPWSRIPSLPEMTKDAGIDYDRFLQCIEKNMSIDEMAEQFNVGTNTIQSLQEHFFHYGISSVIGGD